MPARGGARGACHVRSSVLQLQDRQPPHPGRPRQRHPETRAAAGGPGPPALSASTWDGRTAIVLSGKSGDQWPLWVWGLQQPRTSAGVQHPWANLCQDGQRAFWGRAGVGAAAPSCLLKVKQRATWHGPRQDPQGTRHPRKSRLPSLVRWTPGSSPHLLYDLRQVTSPL